MVTEQHIEGCFIKTYSVEENNALLFLLPGQSMSPRAFWDFELPDGKTHSQHFLEAGIDVVLFDPVGYGNSLAFYQYDRVGYARQIHSVVKTITKKYNSRTILGFSTSTAPAIIASQSYFDRVIIHSPTVKHHRKNFVKHDDVFISNMKKLIEERIGKISDKIIPKPNRIDDWESRISNVLKTQEWKVPAKPLHDVNNYWILRGTHSFDVSKVPPILVIRGEYDYECTTGGYDAFKQIFPNCKEVIIPNSTHFSMWENSYKVTLQAVGEWSKIPCL